MAEDRSSEAGLSDEDEILDVGIANDQPTSVTEEGRGKSVERLAVVADQSSESEREQPAVS